MALLQTRSGTENRRCEGEVKVGSSGGNGGGKLILCFLCQRFPRFQVMTQHLVNAVVSWGCRARVLG